MSRYRVELMRRVSKFCVPVRTFSFDAGSDEQARTLTKMMHVFPDADDCDLAALVAQDGKWIWAEHRA